MTKLHPATRALRAMSRTGYSYDQERILLRHVKPLLDALERDGHGVMFSDRKDVVRCKHIGGCADCRLLAAWKEPIK